MRRVRLHSTDIESSALGFGCASLTAHGDRRDAIALLEHAFASGITHFDVARLYGLGHAEAILGEFLRSKREHVTVTTKFGLQPPSGAIASQAGLISLAKKVLRRFPGLASRARRHVAAAAKGGAFSASEASASLETSLRALGTDRVDLLLLHEGTLADAARDDLLAFLEMQRQRGTVRAFGLGSAAATIGDDATRIPQAHRVLQFENSVCTPARDTMRGAGERAVVTHSALRDLPRLRAAVTADPPAARAASDGTGRELADPAVLATMLLQWALHSNADGIVLVGTTRTAHLDANVRAEETPMPSPSQLQAFARWARASGRTAEADPTGRPATA